jgi:general transcription factor 3C polypeptide 3 (transcription factor C subunit 4)
VHANDEETCVAVARFFMRDYSSSSDSTRLFATLCRLSHSSISWYSSGPSQKHMLRQIKAMDAPFLCSNRSLGADVEQKRLDTCLLMLYGHILFTSTSYTYALSKTPPS